MSYLTPAPFCLQYLHSWHSPAPLQMQVGAGEAVRHWGQVCCATAGVRAPGT